MLWELKAERLQETFEISHKKKKKRLHLLDFVHIAAMTAIFYYTRHKPDEIIVLLGVGKFYFPVPYLFYVLS